MIGPHRLSKFTVATEEVNTPEALVAQPESKRLSRPCLHVTRTADLTWGDSVIAIPEPVAQTQISPKPTVAAFLPTVIDLLSGGPIILDRPRRVASGNLHA